MVILNEFCIWSFRQITRLYVLPLLTRLFVSGESLRAHQVLMRNKTASLAL